MAWVACILTGQSSLASELELLAVRARKVSVVRRLVWLDGLRGHAISLERESCSHRPRQVLRDHPPRFLQVVERQWFNDWLYVSESRGPLSQDAPVV